MSEAFIVAREWNAHGPQDYLSGWDRRYGTVCSGKGAALRFPSRKAAEAAAANAAKLVPTLCTGSLIAYTILSA